MFYGMGKLFAAQLYLPSGFLGLNTGKPAQERERKISQPAPVQSGPPNGSTPPHPSLGILIEEGRSRFLG